MQRKKKHDINIKEVEPDTELLLWEKWVKIRKDETKRLGHAVKRPPADLAMNLLEKVRKEKEWKTVLENAQIDQKPKVRGSPWEQPLRLRQEDYSEPVYEIFRTPVEKGNPPVIEHVSVPKYVQVTEKGLSGVPRKVICEALDAEFLKYRDKRENEFQEKIRKIDPFRPSASGLIIKGEWPKTPPKVSPPLPSIITNAPTEDSQETLCNVYAVRVNNTLFCKDIPGQKLDYLTKMKAEPWHRVCNAWSYYINTPVKRAGRCKLYLQNLGTVALRYCWKKVKKPIPFIPEETYEQVFFFNKNEDVLPPGQSKEILFTFISDIADIYSEFWELNFCNICFFDSPSERLFVNLYADSVEDYASVERKCDIMKSRIERKVITNIATDILADAIKKATTVEPQKYPYEYLFLEAEMFVMNNPVCFYHQTEVMTMKNLYTEMSQKELWDLSIGSWRKKMMEKDYDDRMKYYELLRKSHSDLLKPWYEGENLKKQKYRAMKLLFAQMADKFDSEYERLMDIYCPVIDTEAEEGTIKSSLSIAMDPMVRQNIHNIFYVHISEHVANTIELCAGVLSSLDLDKWIEFNFCQW